MRRFIDQLPEIGPFAQRRKVIVRHRLVQRIVVQFGRLRQRGHRLVRAPEPAERARAQVVAVSVRVVHRDGVIRCCEGFPPFVQHSIRVGKSQPGIRVIRRQARALAIQLERVARPLKVAYLE